MCRVYLKIIMILTATCMLLFAGFTLLFKAGEMQGPYAYASSEFEKHGRDMSINGFQFDNVRPFIRFIEERGFYLNDKESFSQIAATLTDDLSRKSE